MDIDREYSDEVNERLDTILLMMLDISARVETILNANEKLFQEEFNREEKRKSRKREFDKGWEE